MRLTTKRFVGGLAASLAITALISEAGASVAIYGGPLSTSTTDYYGVISSGASRSRATAGASVAAVYTQSLEGEQPALGRLALRLTAAGPDILQGLGVNADGYFSDEAWAIDAFGNAYGRSAIGNSRLGGVTVAVRWAADSTTPTVLNAPTSTSDGISSAFVHNTNAAGLAVGTALWMRSDQISGSQAVTWAPG